MNGLGPDNIEQVRKRQTAKLLYHLEQTNQLTPELRSDLLRSLGYIFEDVESILTAIRNGEQNGKDKPSTR